jgi:hypothetical protein
MQLDQTAFLGGSIRLQVHESQRGGHDFHQIIGIAVEAKHHLRAGSEVSGGLENIRHQQDLEPWEQSRNKANGAVTTEISRKVLSLKTLQLACQRWRGTSQWVMRLYQDEVYQKGEKLIRIVRLDRYEVEFKTMISDPKGPGEVTTMAKKEFCRLLKGMRLVTPVKKVVVEE